MVCFWKFRMCGALRLFCVRASVAVSLSGHQLSFQELCALGSFAQGETTSRASLISATSLLSSPWRGAYGLLPLLSLLTTSILVPRWSSFRCLGLVASELSLPGPGLCTTLAEEPVGSGSGLTSTYRSYNGAFCLPQSLEWQ